MNRGVFGSLVQQMMMSSSSVNNNTRPPLEQTFPIPSSPMFFQYPQPSSNVHPLMNNLCHASLDSPESWTQIFMGGLGGDEEKYMSSAPNFQTKNMIDNWQDQVMYSSEAAHNLDGVKQGYSGAGFMYSHEDNEKIQQESSNKCLWNQVMPTNSSSPTSCLNASFSSNNMMDFSNNNNKERGQQQHENSSECNSTAAGAPFKKARIQVSSSPQLSTFKVRKEKMGDRITALHQLISPFGKTDTASVLLEAIGYIRFLHGQIEALSSPYLGTGSGNNRQSAHGDQMARLFPEEPGQLLNGSGIKKRRHEDQQEGNDDVKKDLKSRGLCLVPISFTLHAGSENGADFWAPMAFGGGF